MKNQRSDGRFQKWAAVGKKPDGSPLRVCVYADTPEELDRRVLQVKEDARLGKLEILPVTTFEAAADEWLKSIEGNKSKSTINGYRSLLNRFLLPVMGDSDIHSISADNVTAAIRKAQDEKYSNSTVMQIKSVALQIERFAIEKKLIAEPALKEIKYEKQKEPERIHTLTKKEISIILNKNTGHRLCLPVMIMLFCGLNGAEIRVLKSSDISLEDKTITVTRTLVNCKFVPEISPQTERVLPVPKVLYDYLIEYLPDEDGLICPNAHGLPMTNAELQTAWKGYCRFLYREHQNKTKTQKQLASQSEFFTSQNVRQTYLKLLFDKGLNIREIQYLAGHSTLEQTMVLAERYLKVDAKRAAERLEGVLTSLFQK